MDFKNDLSSFEKHFAGLFAEAQSEAVRQSPSPDLEKFWEGLKYSLFGGGKRFRPLLSLLTARALGKSEEKVFPYAAAVEMIHTYSLIHDDLPCLDNDDERRGRPTHHKVYGEDMALLAGDALQAFSFYLLAKSYSDHPRLAQIIRDLAFASGVQGMVGGQVLDMLADQSDLSTDQLRLVHELKTGALIRVAVTGAAQVCEASTEELSCLEEFGKQLGLAFQIADDIQDAREGETSKNYVAFFGEERSKDLLKRSSVLAGEQLSQLKHNSSGLKSLIKYNLDRV